MGRGKGDLRRLSPTPWKLNVIPCYQWLCTPATSYKIGRPPFNMMILLEKHQEYNLVPQNPRPIPSRKFLTLAKRIMKSALEHNFITNQTTLTSIIYWFPKLWIFIKPFNCICYEWINIQTTKWFIFRISPLTSNSS